MIQVLIDTIRSEIASCSEKAYPSIPLSNAKNLLFLESEGAVLSFAKARDGWAVKDGRIYFPVWSDGDQDVEGAVNGVHSSEKGDVLSASGTVIENVVGYARELETIV
jgi:26S proteasome regulatory subunit N12